MPTSKTLYIRNVPPEVHRKVHGQAAAMGLTLAEWVERAARLMNLRKLSRSYQPPHTPKGGG